MAALTLLLVPVLVLQGKPAGDYPGAAIDVHLRKNQYLAALRAAEKEAKADTEGMFVDRLGLLQSFVGLEREALVTFDSMGAEPLAPVASSPIDDATALDAIPAIVEAAKGRRIVILNESHHVSRHRAFAAELARALRKEGFDTFAAETFADVEGTAKRGYPDHSTGYYSQDPVFGELVRTVLELGYRTVAYEATFHAPQPDQDQRMRINDREIQQSANLKERVFDAFPGARLFVYVGYSHATENWVDKGGPKELAWMAARLASLTGLDPLTVDQTGAMPRSEPRFESPHRRRALDAGKLDRPRVFRQGDGTFFVAGTYAGKVDMQVFHPPLGESKGRPDWLARGRRAVDLPAEAVKALDPERTSLVQSFRASESEDAIPADQFVVRGRSERPVLLLAPGRYRIVVQDEAGAERARVENVPVE